MQNSEIKLIFEQINKDLERLDNLLINKISSKLDQNSVYLDSDKLSKLTNNLEQLDNIINNDFVLTESKVRRSLSRELKNCDITKDTFKSLRDL